MPPKPVKKQKIIDAIESIITAYRCGKTMQDISKDFHCSPAFLGDTLIRTIGANKYHELIRGGGRYSSIPDADRIVWEFRAGLSSHKIAENHQISHVTVMHIVRQHIDREQVESIIRWHRKTLKQVLNTPRPEPRKTPLPIETIIRQYTAGYYIATLCRYYHVGEWTMRRALVMHLGQIAWDDLNRKVRRIFRETPRPRQTLDTTVEEMPEPSCVDNRVIDFASQESFEIAQRANAEIEAKGLSYETEADWMCMGCGQGYDSPPGVCFKCGHGSFEPCGRWVYKSDLSATG